MTEQRNPSFLESIIPILFLVALLWYNVFFVFGDDALSGSNQIILLLSAAVAGLIAYFRLKLSWDSMLKAMVKSIQSAMPSIMILLLIGSLAGTWLLSGIVPAMIYYGLQILNPTIFLFAACIVCAIVSIATGSSWSTIATVGLALLGIGKALGISEGWIAGAIISGAYFGDKMSPLSDTTNLAAAMAGTDLFTHIRYMTITTVPSIMISLVIFMGAGFAFSAEGTIQNIDTILVLLDQSFNINGWLFIVPVVVIAMIVRKVPAIPALLTGTILGAIFAIIFQPQAIQQVAGNMDSAAYVAAMKAMYTDINIVTNNQIVDDLLSTGGMSGMLNTVWLIICAMIFGGVMEGAGMLQRITQEIIHLAQSTGSLVLSTVVTAIGFNLTASDQYLAIVVPGRMFRTVYRDRGLMPQNLSRTLEDSGTVTSVLVPWNTCGATQSTVLGVATLTYLPYCFFNIISPFMTVLFAYLGVKIAKKESQEALHAG